MKCKENKIKLNTITLIALLSLSAIIVTFPIATAQDEPWNTFPICDITPNPVGVNQQVLIILGVTHATAWPQPGWYGLTVDVTKPDGSQETLGPFTTDTTGLTGATYTPNQVGIYTFVTNFPEQVVEEERPGRSIPKGTIMNAGQSEPVELEVLSEPLEYFPSAPMPDNYWTRPIDAQNREWTSISGSWLDGSFMRTTAQRYAPDNDGPDTGHILWKKPYAEGGLVGGDMGWYSFETGDAYEGKWSNPIIIAGILISNRHTRGTQETFAIELRTGEELWSRTLGSDMDLSLSASFGQIMYWDTMNMHGSFAYVWATSGSTWYAFDPFTGRWEYTIENVPGGSRVPGPKGEILLYDLDLDEGTMTMWNSTAVWYNYALDRYSEDAQPAYPAGRWRPLGMTLDGSWGIEWTVSIPNNLPGGVEVVIPMDRIIGSNTNWAGSPQQPNPQFWAINIKPGQEGQLIFNEPWELPIYSLHVDFPGFHPYSVEDGVFIVTAKETRQHWALSLDTGETVWGPTTHFEPYMNSFTNLYMDPWGAALCAYGKLYTAGHGGVVNAYDLSDGQHLWEYVIDDPYSEQLFGNAWPAPIGFITDGKIYMFHMEHSVINPMPRGAPAVCLDAETGQEIWRINGLRLGTRWGGQPIIGDSVITGFSSYDNSIVAMGKGPSELTVNAEPKVVSRGSSVIVEGTVMDVSPGTRDYELTSRFPNGVPVVSDADMSEWMLFVYQNRMSRPNVNGVTVRLEAVDPNGNYQNLGTTTSDAYGNFGFAFEPGVEGTYMIMATFEGSGAYYGSYSSTYINVDPASAAGAPIEPEEQPAGAPLITTEVAIIAAIVIVAAIGLVAYWALKRK